MEPRSNYAYMLRNDGKAFPCRVHYYGNPTVDFIHETLYAAEWLYNHTNHNDVKTNIMSLIKSYMIDCDFNDVDDLIEYLSSDDVPYVCLTEEFLDQHYKEIMKSPAGDTENLNTLICDELNQEFCRVRFGGMYNTDKSSNECVFRISSVNFNWFNIIYMFVADHRSRIDSVTICKDEESSGYSDYFYKHRGETFYRMPIDEFMEIGGRPVVEEITFSTNTDSLCEQYKNVNMSRIHTRMKILYSQENKTYYRKVMNEG